MTHPFFKWLFATVLSIAVSVVFCTTASAHFSYKDTIPGQITDSLRFPIQDRRGDFLSNPSNNPFDLKDPKNIIDSIEYDPKTQMYYILEKVGSKYYRKPTALTFDEVMRIKAKQSEDDYFRKRADVLDELNRKKLQPKFAITDNLFNRLFGTGKVDIKPQGNVDITAGYRGQKVDNPTLPEISRKTGGLDFDMNANINVVGNIGSKLKLPIAYNTQANFNFMNQLKLDYTGGPDDIVKKIEAGNTNFTTKSTLITGAQSLFGIKMQLQFGKLMVTGVLANQTSQSQSVGTQGGAATMNFQFKADDYDENRNFLLAQYFRNNYKTAMSSLPIVKSQVNILRMEVWVTNRNGATTQARQIVGLMDLGESSPYNKNFHNTSVTPFPSNNSNDEYGRIVSNANSRNPSSATSVLNSIGLTQVQDFEIVYGRKLDSTAYQFNPQVGFITLSQTLQPDDVLAVAYQYSYNGHIYQVGEFSSDITPDSSSGNYSGTSQVIYLKLLKATAQRTNLPIWDLMMKNVYTLKTASGSPLYNIQSSGFQLNVLYDEPSKGDKRYLPAGDQVGVPLLSLLGLDRLNSNNAPQPDGVFDYIEGFTVVSQQARVIFPVLEPFGKDLDTVAFRNSPQLASQYIFQQLYDTIKAVASTYANVDRYILSGVAKGQASSDISLGALNVPSGSVTVTAGGQTLKENVDYVVDYNMGSVKVINQAIINSGIPVNVKFENNASFGTQQRSFMGLRLDYVAKNTSKEALSFGGTIERLSERPYFTIANYGEDPIRNVMYGLDFNYKSQLPGLTRLLNRMPFYSSKEMSSISAYGESAFLKPGHAPQIGKGSSGQIYIDDFEGSTSSIDLRFPLTSWALASAPQNNGLFPEASLNDDLSYGYNRAKIAWYNIDPTMQDNTNTTNPVRSYQDFTDPRISAISIQQLFPNQTPQYGQAQLVTFDIAYYPTDKGPYNFDVKPSIYSKGINPANGKLNNPETRWGGIMRSIDQTDFETNNIQYIEFWMQNPYLNKYTNASPTGQLYIDLGSVSEDIVKDGKRLFENGLPTPNIAASTDTSVWGRVPLNPIQVTNAFSNNPSDRPYQDVGFDGINDDSERVQFSSYLQALQTVTTPGVYQNVLADPSGDNFLNYRDGSYDNASANILGRYKNINNPQGNSPVATTGQQFITAFTQYPDEEDLDHDNTLNTLEQYFEYKVDMSPQGLSSGVGQNYITSVDSFTTTGSVVQQKWYQFRIPISSYVKNVGNMPDFKSIRFIRMYMTGFSDSIVCRFASFQLIRDSWRSFSYVLDTTGQYIPLPVTGQTTSFNVTAVNIEQNSSRYPVPYVIPPGIARQQQISTNNTTLLINEQSLSLQICNLAPNDARGVYKTVNLDLRRYGNMNLFVHAEGAGGGVDRLNDYDLSAVIRIGSDFISNFYEIKIPLKKTLWGATAATDIWPDSNSLNLALSRLVKLKEDRNNAVASNVYYTETDNSGKSYSIMGNPNLGAIQAFFLGVRNESLNQVCTEVWFDELRLSNINDQGGWAALGRVDLKLADLGTMYMSGSYKTIGFGSIDQHINERSLDDIVQWNAAANLELGKLLPKKLGLSIPTYASLSTITDMPQYDPFDLDIKLKDKIRNAPSSQRDSIRSQAVDATSIKTLNFTNVRLLNTSGKKPKLWSLKNFDLSYSFTNYTHHSPIAFEDDMKTYKAGLGYNYSKMPKYWEPLKTHIKSKSLWLALFKDFNFNPMPNVISFREDVNRQFGAFRSRNIGGKADFLPETFNKFFNIKRSYVLRWDLTRSLNIDFSAINNSTVDEDSGRLDKAGRSRMWEKFWKGGRNLLYQQTANVTYTLPTKKIPALDWTTVRIGYSANYSWTAASLLAQSLGNILQNGQTKNVNGELDFSKLYSKSRWLRAIDFQPSAGLNKSQPIAPKIASDTSKGKQRLKDPKQLPEVNTALKVFGRLVTSFKRMSINYSENSASTIYGYMDSTQLMGVDLKTSEPGLGYIFGKQPGEGFVDKLAQKGLITTDPTLNFQNLQSFNQRLSITSTLQPFRDFNIDVNLDKTFGKTYSELFKDTIGGGQFLHLNPYTTGTFSISFISLNTLFQKTSPDQISTAFAQFENYRTILSARLGAINPYSGKMDANGYYVGYQQYAQDVLIPAFIAAYSGKDPKKIALINENSSGIRSNPFSGYLPKPNWRMSYNGLARLPGFDRIFTSFNLTNAYSSTLSMGSFGSSLLYQDPLGVRYPGFIDTVSGNFVPYFAIPNITIIESFSPLINIDMQFVNKLQARIGYSKTRQLSLSLVDYQLTESHSNEFTFGGGLKKKGVKLPFKIKMPGKAESSKKLDNEMNFRLDISIRDDITSNSIIDQNNALPTGGQKTITISPSVDYVISNRINLKFYFDQRRVTPKISTSPPIVTTRAGVQIRISLAP